MSRLRRTKAHNRPVVENAGTRSGRGVMAQHAHVGRWSTLVYIILAFGMLAGCSKARVEPAIEPRLQWRLTLPSSASVNPPLMSNVRLLSWTSMSPPLRRRMCLSSAT